jgi:hypothetical protein
MKKKISYLVMSLSMTFSLITPVAAHAMGIASTQQEGRARTNTVYSTTTISTTTAENTDKTTTTDDSSGRTSRIDAYKKNAKETLTAEAKARISARCVAAQAVVKNKIANNETITTTRETAYEEIIGNLQGVVTAASAQTADVADLQANISVLQAKIVSFKTANTTYQQALTDLNLMDCKADPSAFKATLQAAREDQLAVFTSAKDIRNYLNDTVKVTLKALKTKLTS